MNILLKFRFFQKVKKYTKSPRSKLLDVYIKLNSNQRAWKISLILKKPELFALKRNKKKGLRGCTGLSTLYIDFIKKMNSADSQLIRKLLLFSAADGKKKVINFAIQKCCIIWHMATHMYIKFRVVTTCLFLTGVSSVMEYFLWVKYS